MKHFMYFESTEGGMAMYGVYYPDDLKHLYGWMHSDCQHNDELLLSWMIDAEVGAMHEHRLGCLVRLKDTYE